MGTAIKHPVLDRVKPSFVIFDIWALPRLALRVRSSGQVIRRELMVNRRRRLWSCWR